MKAANKPALADGIWALILKDHQKITCILLMVAHCFIEFHGRKAEHIILFSQKHNDYVIKHYRRANDVFDGYDNGPSAKDNAHLRRTSKQMTEMHFTGSTTMNVKEVK